MQVAGSIIGGATEEVIRRIIDVNFNKEDLAGVFMLERSGKGNNAWLEEKTRAFQAKCRAAGLKMTPQRMAVYKVLVKSKDHPSAEMVFRKVRRMIPNISLDTVNRTLLMLSDISVAFVVEGSGDPKRFDGNLETHQHFKCVRCRRIFDFHHKAFDNLVVPKELAKQFSILRKTVYLEGICGSCRRHRIRSV